MSSVILWERIRESAAQRFEPGRELVKEVEDSAVSSLELSCIHWLETSLEVMRSY